jgi:mercuric ion binding protein
MRPIVVAVAALSAAVLGPSAGRADNVKITGVHLCCGSCVRAAQGILGKVEGVSDIACDQAAQTVTFTAVDAKTTQKAFDRLLAGGFFGRATADGKELPVKNEAGKDGVKQVTVQDVHVCCKKCQAAVEKLFPKNRATVSGSGAQRTVTVSGEGLNPAGVLETLRKAGFNGKAK